MVIGVLTIKSDRVVENNPFYGNYVVSENYTQTIVNEKYVGLVPPKNGLSVVLADKGISFIIGKYIFTGEPENEVDETTEFSATFTYKGCAYEVIVDHLGQLISFDEWLSVADFEDGNYPDNHYTKKDKDIKWKLVEM